MISGGFLYPMGCSHFSYIFSQDESPIFSSAVGWRGDIWPSICSHYGEAFLIFRLFQNKDTWTKQHISFICDSWAKKGTITDLVIYCKILVTVIYRQIFFSHPLLKLQGLAKRWSLGCENAIGKARQKW